MVEVIFAISVDCLGPAYNLFSRLKITEKGITLTTSEESYSTPHIPSYPFGKSLTIV